MKIQHLRHLNFRQLLYFHEVVCRGTVTAAARAMHVSQPTVSSQIKALEEALEVSLLERVGRRMQPTAQGQAVARYAAEIFDTANEMLAAVDRIDGAHVVLEVGVADIVPQPFALALFALLERPGLELHVVKGHPSDLLPQLSAHLLHVVLTDAPTNEPARHHRYHNHLLGSSPVVLVGPDSSVGPLRLPDALNGAAVVLPTAGSVLRRTLDAWADLEGVVWDVRGAFEDPEMLARHAHATGAYVPLPEVVVDDYLQRFGGAVVGRFDGVDERFYAITAERRLSHPALRELTTVAPTLFSPHPQPG